MCKNAPIGFMDSGMGGLTILSQVIRELPGENIVYFADNLHLPYGGKPPAEVGSYVFSIMDYLIKKWQIKYMVIACNTAAVVALQKVRQQFSLPIIGPVCAGAKKAVQHSKNQKIGLLATEGTVRSGAYQEAIARFNPKAELTSVAAPLLIPLIEMGALSGPIIEGVLQEYLQPIKKAGCDALILGCTHFPYLTDSIQKIVGGQMELIFPGQEIGERIKKHLTGRDLLNPQKKGEHIFLSSQLSRVSEEFLEQGDQILGMRLNFQQINLTEFNPRWDL